MQKPKFSIIIPTYNSSKHIKNCLSSIVSQTFEDFEVLIIDNLSLDNTLEICNSFDDTRIKIFSAKDKGIYDAMYKGVYLATGEWLYFLGSDDSLYDNEVLENIFQFIVGSKSLIIYGDVNIVGDAGWAHDSQVYDGEFNLKKLLSKNICHQAIFYAKKIFKNYNYNIAYNVCSDYDLNLRLFSKYSFRYIDKIIANFNGGGYSGLVKDKNFNLVKAIIDNYFYRLWHKDFYSFYWEFYLYSKTSISIFQKIYFRLIYIKHRLFKN